MARPGRGDGSGIVPIEESQGVHRPDERRVLPGDFAGAAAYATRSVALGQEAGDLSSVAFGLALQTLAAAEAGDIPTAVRLAGEARAAASAIGDSWTEGPALYFLGYLAIRNGDLDDASRLWEEAAAARADPWGVAIFTTCLIGLRAVQRRHAEANVLATHAISLCGDLEDPVRTAWCLESIASAQAAQGQPLRSARLWGASGQLMERSAASLPPSFAWVREHYFDGAKDALGDAVFQQALSDGRAMSMRQSIQYALEACKA